MQTMQHGTPKQVAGGGVGPPRVVRDISASFDAAPVPSSPAPHLTPPPPVLTLSPPHRTARRPAHRGRWAQTGEGGARAR